MVQTVYMIRLLDAAIQTLLDLDGQVLLSMHLVAEGVWTVTLQSLSNCRFGSQLGEHGVVFSSGGSANHLFLFQRFQARHRYLLRANHTPHTVWTNHFHRMPI